MSSLILIKEVGNYTIHLMTNGVIIVRKIRGIGKLYPLVLQDILNMRMMKLSLKVLIFMKVNIEPKMTCSKGYKVSVTVPVVIISTKQMLPHPMNAS